MKKRWILIIAIPFLFLTGCFSNSAPIYINQIEIYQENEPLVGTLKYYNGSKWIDYDSNITSKTDVYYSVDVILGSSININFDIYSPDININDMKINFSYNFIPETYNSAWATINEKDNNIIKSNFFIESITGLDNVIEIYGWLTDQGPKYSGAKTKNTNYVLKGIHFNILP